MNWILTKVIVLKWFIYYWDVLFTLIDNTQLRIYVHLKNKLRELEEKGNEMEKELYYQLQEENEYKELEAEWSKPLKSHKRRIKND